ncbi:unnamed protein product [Caenorhabditis auriculariae]|uniref:Uncharacterized protein n=1 Tax=Caenorhabditis auriculariae TaxID=2777116 RepID=A0A8S1HCB5_9PELO|nr:unnamed protein product [Caenorhabditis auriculariae]
MSNQPNIQHIRFGLLFGPLLTAFIMFYTLPVLLGIIMNTIAMILVVSCLLGILEAHFSGIFNILSSMALLLFITLSKPPLNQEGPMIVTILAANAFFVGCGIVTYTVAALRWFFGEDVNKTRSEKNFS